MPVSGTGNAGVGPPFAETEFVDWVGTITLANGVTFAQGQTVFRDATQIAGAPGTVGTSAQASLSDIVIMGNSANAAATSCIYGVYQGPAFTNSTGQPVTYTLLFRRQGYGVVLATAKTAGTAVTVGGVLIGEPGTDQYVLQGAAAYNKTVGTAQATGAAVTNGATIITVPGSGQTNTLVNANIWVF
jgi:hypothetical protein